MSYSRRPRYSASPPPKRYRSPSPSPRRYRSISRSISRSRSPSVVIDVHLVVDPWTRESCGFGFVTMEDVDAANRCIKYLDRSVLEGRVIMVEKARRRRGRTPTPGRSLGLRTVCGRRRTPSYSPHRRSPSYSPYRRSYSRSPSHSSDRSQSRSDSPPYRRWRSYSPDYRQRRSYSHSRSPDYSRSPMRYGERSYSPYDREYSPDDSYYGRRRRYRSVSHSVSPRPLRSSRGRSYSRSVSPRPRRISRRSYFPSSVSPEPMRRKSSRRSYSWSVSPGYRSSRSYKGFALQKYSRSCSDSQNPSVSSRLLRSPSPKSTSPSS